MCNFTLTSVSIEPNALKSISLTKLKQEKKIKLIHIQFETNQFQYFMSTWYEMVLSIAVKSDRRLHLICLHKTLKTFTSENYSVYP